MVLGVTAFLTLPVAIFAPKGIVPLLSVSALLLLVLVARRQGSLIAVFKQLPMPLAGLLAAFLSFAAISVLWSINPAGHLRAIVGLGLASLAGLVIAASAARLAGRQRSFFETALIAGGIVGLALIGFEMLTGAVISRAVLELKGKALGPGDSYLNFLNSGVTVVALYMWPWLLALRRRFGNAAALLGGIAAVAVLVTGELDTPLLALVLGLIVTAAAMILPGNVPALPGVVARLAAVAIALAVAAAPLLPGALPDPLTEGAKMPFLSRSAQHRLVIWRTTVDHIAKRPVLGIGFNGSRALYGKEDKVLLKFAIDDPSRSWSNLFEPIPLHPHNGILQVWLELGGVGAALLAAILMALLRLVATVRAERIEWAAGLGMLAAGLSIFSLSFGAWQSWWQGTLWLMGAYMAATAGNRGDVQPTPESGKNEPRPKEVGGPTGPEPTRYGDWEKKGRCIDF